MNNILKLFKKLDYDIQYYYGLYHDNFILQDLSYKFIYNDLFNFNGDLIYSYKKLKKLYIKLKLELDQAIKDNDKIKEFSNKMKNEINGYYTNI